MNSYKNFTVSLYITAHTVETIGLETLKLELAFFRKHISLGKVYIENYRGGREIKEERLRELKAFFEKEGIITAGGITATAAPGEGLRAGRHLDVLCYTDPSYRERIKRVSETAASVFDEVIFDDFYFTNCTCDSCLKEKGARSWEEFRLDLMTRVSKELVAGPGKKKNPNVRFIIKYPNWVESFSRTGYNPEKQPLVFDGVFTGTEARDPSFTQQHLPKYASYSLMRWLDNVAPGRNGGGWFDSFDCESLDGYLAQADLTVFGKAREVMLFCWGLLYDTIHVPAVGFRLHKLDEIAGLTGKPLGVPVYIPYHSSGEYHFYDLLGMAGIPVEPVPDFPESDGIIVLQKDSAQDPSVLGKMEKRLRAGRDILMTSGFLDAMLEKGITELTSLSPSGHSVSCRQFAVDTDICGFKKILPSAREIRFPEYRHATNGTWQIVAGITDDWNIPVLMQDFYGSGKLFTFVVPECLSDIVHLRPEVLDRLRTVLSVSMPCRLDGPGGACLFAYDNETVIVKSFAPASGEWALSVPGPAHFTDGLNGMGIPSEVLSSVTTSRVSLRPGEFKVIRTAKI